MYINYKEYSMADIEPHDASLRIKVATTCQPVLTYFGIMHDTHYHSCTKVNLDLL